MRQGFFSYPPTPGRKAGRGDRLGRPIRLDPKRFANVGSTGLGGQIKAVENMINYISQQKVEKTSDAMIRLAAQDRWPSSPEDVIGYIGRTSSGRKFKTANFLVNYSLKYPLKTYDKTLRFEPTAVGNLEDINDAAQLIMSRFFQYASTLPLKATGDYRRSVRMYVRSSPKDPLPKPYYPGMLENMTSSAQIIIASSDPGGSSIEAHFVERTKKGGILFQAAKDVRKKYRKLIIKYFSPAANKLGLPYEGSRIYGIPVVIVGLRGQQTTNTLSKPGRNIRRRRSARNSGMANAYGAKQMFQYEKGLRKVQGYRRTDERNYGNAIYSYRSAWRKANRRR